MSGFLRDRRGNFAVIAALVMLTLIVSLGGAVDMARAFKGRVHLQNAADAAALAIATSQERAADKIAALARQYVFAQVADQHIVGVTVERATIDDDNKIVVRTSGKVDTTFLKLINYDALYFDLTSEAERPNEVNIEVALVLDNTFSMDDADAGGTRKIDALKTAAKLLVDELITSKNTLVSIGIVPYSNNVNVGLGNAGKAWLSDTDNFLQTSARSCRFVSQEKYCHSRAPSYKCVRYYDGVAVTETCSGACLDERIRYFDPPKEVCSGGTTSTYKFFGCVGSRRTGTTHLHDGSPAERYPAFRTTSEYSETTKACLMPIVDLRKDKDAIKSAIDDLIISRGDVTKSNSYKPLTYIPAGLIWGQNLLSPSEPFTTAAPYPLPDDKTLRKIMILMTDGENSLRLASNRDGTHTAPAGAQGEMTKQLAQTNANTTTLCDYSKSKGIEIYTVALMVDDPVARTLLQGCATGQDRYFDASDSAALVDAFRKIAGSINAVRIVK